MQSILYIIQADAESGSGKCAIELLARLREDNIYQPIVVTQHQNSLNQKCNEMHIENYAFHYARTCCLGMGYLGWFIAFVARPFLNFFSYLKLSKRINFKQVVLIHSNDSSIDFGAYISRKQHKKHIWHIREFLVFDSYLRPIIKNLPRYIVKNSSQVITVSNALKNHFINNSCNQNKIQTIYDGVEIPNQIRNLDCTQNSNLIKVVCLGVYCAAKGQATLLKAISILPKSIQEHFHFDFWGDCFDNTKQELLLFSKKHQLENIITFNEKTNKAISILKNYDIGIQPSHSEGFSRVTAEYMVAGLCVVAANEGAIPELIQHKVTGYLYEDYNANNLANQLVYCYEHQNEMKTLAKAAQKKALNEFTIDNNFNQIINIYNKIIGF